MCGIFCSLTKNPHNINEITSKCEHFIKRRGPDHFNSIQTKFNNYTLKFSASVLWLQGKKINLQPVETEFSIFVYNGDVFGGTSISDEERTQEGDTILFLKALENDQDICRTLRNIQGPYAFIYLDKRTGKLYFSRDQFGRRSLLISKYNNSLILSSVAANINKEIFFQELPSVGVFYFDLETDQFHLHPWNPLNITSKYYELCVQIPQVILKNMILEPQEYKKFTPSQSKHISILDELKDKKDPFNFLLSHPIWMEKVVKLEMLLEQAISKRIINQPKYCSNCIKTQNFCNDSRIGILFSGGIDCSILALISDKFVDKSCPIDLLNVSFGETLTPDRATGLNSLKELRNICPDRVWNFVPINISISELNEARTNHIKHLIYPLCTILDDSLGCALWFASRGKSESYTTPCRVLLVGMGADELFGGYTRHRKAFKDGWEALHNSLLGDWENIAYRNLGRDDRVVSDHGRQLRTPYLDEELVKYVLELPVWEKTFPTHSLPAGIGDKILLRSLAYHLGLKNVSTYAKRALQFGSRIANKKENAHKESPRLK